MRETLDLLDNVTIRDVVSNDQSCKRMRADFGKVDLDIRKISITVSKVLGGSAW